MHRSIGVVEVRETFYFSHQGALLRQWILLTLDNPSCEPRPARVAIQAAGQEAVTELEIAHGVREYRCYAPALWPEPAVDCAALRIETGDEVIEASASVGNYRPWTIYLLSDTCTDYTWVYSRAAYTHRDDSAVTLAELDTADATADGPNSDRNHYNMVVAREVEFFLERYPDQADRLFDAIRDGTIGLNPIYNMAITCDLSLEELIRQLYPAREWARQQRLDIGYANHQETPTIAWAAATVLAQSGVSHLVKSILPYECPWAERLEEPPLFIWEGPDGSQILVRWRNRDYVEGRFVLRDLRATNTALHDQIVPKYQELGDGYPLDAIALVGCYGDLAPNTSGLAAKKAAVISEYNAQAWEYPKLVNASHRQFWDDVDSQIADGARLPVIRGDYGASWDAWPACLAHDFAQWRRAQERAGTADKLAAVASRLDQGWLGPRREKLADGWMNLIYLADHAWNGSNPDNLALNSSLRRDWQVKANDAFDTIAAEGLAALGAGVPTGENESVLVFNGLGWQRSGVVRLVCTDGGGAIRDVVSGQLVPCQVGQSGEAPVLSFEARDVPPVGYRVYEKVAADPGSQEAGDLWKVDGCSLEGPFYALEVSETTGGFVSLFDKTRQRELVDPGSPYHLNQCLYYSDGVEHTPETAEVMIGDTGPVFAQVIVRSSLKNTRVTTTITLYAGVDRVDIENALEKLPTSERQELDFAFPLYVPDRRYRFEAPGAIIEPGIEQRPGAGQAVTAVRHFVDVFNDDFGMTLSQADSGIVMFGSRTSQGDPLSPDPSNSTVLALAMDNVIDWHESIRDQAGVTEFRFRYALRGHGGPGDSGGFDPTSAVRFGWEDNNELLPLCLATGQSGDLPAGANGFVEVSPGNAILTCLKVAEEEGLILRLWECAGLDTTASIKVNGMGTVSAAEQTDPLEENGVPLVVQENSVSVDLPTRGLATVRLQFE